MSGTPAKGVEKTPRPLCPDRNVDRSSSDVGERSTYADAAFEETFGPLTSDALTRDYRVLQRKHGHRYSLDDVMTAFVAARTQDEATPKANTPNSRPVTYLDIGCGVGSVLLMTSWRLKTTSLLFRALGVEAQAQSFELARQNVSGNQAEKAVSVVHADLRGLAKDVNRHTFCDPTQDLSSHQLEGHFDLITGTPPYFPVGTATEPPDAQRNYARIEHRGGVEAYLDAIAFALQPDGHAILCVSASQIKRTLAHVGLLGLRITDRIIAHPRAERPPLFVVCTLRKRADVGESVTHFFARDSAGQRTRDYHAVRAYFGLGPSGD